MMEFLHLIGKALLSPPGSMLVPASVLLAAIAIRLSPTRATGRFILVLVALWLAFSAWSAIGSSSLRSTLPGMLWGFSIVGLYALVLGPLVAKAKPPRAIIAASIALLVVQFPLSLISGLFFGCYVGHACP